MNKLLLATLLLIFSCEELLESVKEGCTTETACNYDSTATKDDGSCTYVEENYDCDGNCTATIDCLNVCGGNATVDDCGVCDGDATNDCAKDCADVAGGTAVLDDCGICTDGTTELEPNYLKDCAGVCGGNSWQSDCGCVSIGNSGDDCDDCAGTPNGMATTDNCGVCDSDSMNDCVKDGCEVWGGHGFNEFGNYCDDLNFIQDLIDTNPGLTGISVQNFGGYFCNWLSGRITQLFYIDPEDEFNLNQLIGLGVIGDGFITNLPESIGDLTNLEYLDISNNQFTNLPSSIGNLTSLIDISLANNQLTSLPSSMSNLINLDRLVFPGNQLIGEIPSWISNLTNLRLIYLNDNQLEGGLPSGIENLTGLERLLIYNNKLTSLPSTLCNLPSDCEIRVDGNWLCDEYHYSCITNWGSGSQSQDQSNCDCAGITGGNTLLGCDGICDSGYILDNCGTCDADASNDCTQDCAGNWGGTATVDDCGVCDGGNSCFTGIGIATLASDNMTVTLNELTITEKIGSYEYYISYTLTNNTSDQSIDEGSFKMYYEDESGGLPQYGGFNIMFPGDTKNRTYTFEELKTKPFGILGYHDNQFFANDPPSGALIWQVTIP